MIRTFREVPPVRITTDPSYGPSRTCKIGIRKGPYRGRKNGIARHVIASRRRST